MALHSISASSLASRFENWQYSLDLVEFPHFGFESKSDYKPFEKPFSDHVSRPSASPLLPTYYLSLEYSPSLSLYSDYQPIISTWSVLSPLSAYSDSIIAPVQ